MLKIYVTFDVDPDAANESTDRTTLTWRNLEEIPRIEGYFGERNIPFTFFVRIDNQIKECYGSYLSVLEQHQALWSRLRRSGNELGWHPHLNILRGGEYLPLRDPPACRSILNEAWQEICTLDFPVTSVRMGEAWQHTETMLALDSFGLKVDSSAIPGRFRHDESRSFDWQPTPNCPYHPSREDYRLEGEDPLRILEVPMTTAPVRATYDTQPLLRYLNPTFRPDVFRSAMTAALSVDQCPAISDLVLIFHPDELMEREGTGLYQFGWPAFRENMQTMFDLLAGRDRPVEYLRLSEAKG